MLNIVHFSTVKVVRCIGAVSIKAVSISTASVRPVVSLNIARKLLLQGQILENVYIIHLHSYDFHHLLCGHCLFHYVIAFSICSANSLNIAHKLFFPRSPTLPPFHGCCHHLWYHLFHCNFHHFHEQPRPFDWVLNIRSAFKSQGQPNCHQCHCCDHLFSKRWRDK